jgi:hypothetical protein
MSPARTLVPLCLLLASTAPVLAQDLPYASLAGQVLQDFGAPDATPETLDLHGLLEENCLHLSAGLYDLYVPAETAVDSESLEDYQRVVLSLLDSQEAWLEWLEADAPDSRAFKQAVKDQKALRKWVGGWKLRYVVRGMEEGERDMLDVLSAKTSVREAAARLATYFESGQALGLDRPAGQREPIVLVEDRVRMVQLCSLGGWLYPQHQGVFWQASIKTWTHFYIDDIKFLATRFAIPRSPSDYATGMRMDTRTATGLEQQIVQLATNSMLANYFGDSIPPTLAGGLAVNLVIDVYGECNTRADGDLRARRTSAREVFVPGGNPNGGILPPNLADSRWRAEQGSDNFVAALKRAMPNGKRGPFLFTLQDERGRRGMEVHAPFLGSGASASPLGDDYYGDQLEFLRSYRCCFLSWLKESGAGKSSRSADAFASLLRSLAAGSSETLEETLAQVYGAPLSAGMPTDDDLEGRFLLWLRKKR